MKKKKLVIKKTASTPEPVAPTKPRYRFSCDAFVDGKPYRIPREADPIDYDNIQSDAIIKPKYKGMFVFAQQRARQMLTTLHKIFPVAELMVQVHDGHATVYRVSAVTFNKDMTPPPKE